MAFWVMGRLGSWMRQVIWVGGCYTEGGNFGGGYRVSHCNQWALLHSCAKMHKAIELPFGVVSVVGRGIGVLDRESMCPTGKGGFGGFSPHWFEWRF